MDLHPQDLHILRLATRMEVVEICYIARSMISYVQTFCWGGYWTKLGYNILLNG